jgi:hypothetical protein
MDIGNVERATTSRMYRESTRLYVDEIDTFLDQILCATRSRGLLVRSVLGERQMRIYLHRETPSRLRAVDLMANGGREARG